MTEKKTTRMGRVFAMGDKSALAVAVLRDTCFAARLGEGYRVPWLH